MVTLFIRHKVADYTVWKKGYDAADGLRKQHGCSAHSVHRDPDDANDVIMTHRFPNLAKARGFTDSPELREAMGANGVQGQPTFWFGEDLEQTGS